MMGRVQALGWGTALGAGWGGTPGWCRHLQGLPSLPELLPLEHSPWIHSKQRANFCLVVGKRKTKTRLLHQFESLVTSEWWYRSVLIPLSAQDTRLGGTHKTLKIWDFKCTAESTVSEMFSENPKGKSGKQADQPSGNSAFLSHKTLSFPCLEKLSTMLRTICFYF